jgi:hypothetical protein
VGEGEIAEPSGIKRILRVRTTAPADLQSLEERLTTLEASGHLKNPAWMMRELRELVPTFRVPESEGVPPEQADTDVHDEKVVWVE